jgi:methylenetetrahydrofolate dehydrogenase (NADP+) / methenyltetrahydrofolate cyclohydrolase
MSAEIFDGRKYRLEKSQRLAIRSDAVKAQGITPKLVIILIGDDPASIQYVNMKTQWAQKSGVIADLVHLNKATEQDLLQLIKVHGSDDLVHGLMVQLPLPADIADRAKTQEIVSNIPREKDVDGLNEDSQYTPATVHAIMCAIEEAQSKEYLPQSLSEMKATVVGYTGAVGRPLVKILEKRVMEVLGVRSTTENPETITRQGDILVTASTKPGIIKKDMVKPGAVVIDVGSPDPEIEQDVREVASFVTPVPGGIGPVTVISLIENTILAAERSLES